MIDIVSELGFEASAAVFTLALFLGMMLLLETGRRIGSRRLAADPIGASAGVGTVDGAVFGLMGLLLAFTFSGAATRFDLRRALIVEEANAIGTAYLRLDVVPPSLQPQLRDQFRQYIDARLETYRQLPDIEASKRELARSIVLQGQIWKQAVAACGQADFPSAAMLVLPALNAMIDITTTRTMAGETHPPPIVFLMLYGLALASALLAGYGMAAARHRGWLHMIAFAAVMAIAVYVILDIEFPRLGLIRVDSFDRALAEVRDSIN